MSSPDKEQETYARAAGDSDASDAEDKNGGSENGGEDSGDDKPPRGEDGGGTGTDPEPGGLGGGPGGGGSGGGVGAHAKRIHAPLVQNAGWMYACGTIILLLAVLGVCLKLSPIRVACLIAAIAAFLAAVRAGMCFQRAGNANDHRAAADGQRSLVWLLRLLTAIAALFAVEMILELI